LQKLLDNADTTAPATLKIEQRGNVALATATTVKARTTLIIADNTTVTVGANTLTVNGILTFTDDSSELLIRKGATLAAGPTGQFHAKLGVSPTTDGSGIALTVYNETSLTTPTAFTSDDPSGPGASVTLTTAGSTSNGTCSDYVIGNAIFAVANSVNGGSSAATSSTTAVTSEATSETTPAAAGGIMADGTATAFSLEGSS
jgi:hypothetical protein